MIWTVLSQWEMEEQSGPAQLTELNWQGRVIIAEQRDGRYYVRRLISGLSADYFRPEFQPGTELKQIWERKSE